MLLARTGTFGSGSTEEFLQVDIAGSNRRTAGAVTSLVGEQVSIAGVSRRTSGLVSITAPTSLQVSGANRRTSGTFTIYQEPLIQVLGVNRRTSGVLVVANEVPWSPADITTILWLKEEGSAGSWTDHSGNNNHATQVTGTSQPSLTNTLNGLTVRTFDGSNDYLETPSLTLNTPTSLFVVFRTETLGEERALINQQYGDVVRPWQHYFSSLGRLVDWRTGAYISSITAGNYFILSEVQSSTNVGGVMMWRDGNNGVASVSSASFADSRAISIGRAQTTGLIGWMQGRVAEIVLVGSAVDVSTRQKIEGYLAHKWGLTSNLPSNHPYKTDPPTT